MPVSESSKIIVSEQQLFKNFFWYVSFRYVSYVKRYFQELQWSTFFRVQISQIFLFSKMPVSKSSKITVWEQHLFKKHFGKEDLGICLPYIKRYFQEHQWSAFFFWAQRTQILLFSRMLVSERSNIKVWERHIFQNFSCYGNFRYLSIFHKKVSSGAPVRCFFL